MPRSKKQPEDTTIGITLMIEQEPILHSVPVGLDDLPSFVIRTGETPSGVDVQVSTGRPFVKDAESLDKIADFFEMLGKVFRNEDFVKTWIESQPVSETE